jgi:dTDP-4-dehydrorhamnose reductase
MRIWLLGAHGQLGQAIQQVLPCTASGREVDVGSESSLQSAYQKLGPFTHIINCAAYTAVDLAEKERQEAYRVNALGPKWIGKLGPKVIHISTDYVFGRGWTPWREEDSPAPLNVYGKTKWEGEKQLPETALIIRTSWLFSPFGRNFITFMTELLKNRPSLSVVDNQIGSPTSALDLARALPHLLSYSGLYHFANGGETSRYGQTRFLADRLGLKPVLEPVSSHSFGGAAERPPYSVLNTTKIEQILGPIRPWQEALDEIL